MILSVSRLVRAEECCDMWYQPCKVRTLEQLNWWCLGLISVCNKLAGAVVLRPGFFRIGVTWASVNRGGKMPSVKDRSASFVMIARSLHCIPEEWSKSGLSVKNLENNFIKLWQAQDVAKYIMYIKMVTRNCCVLLLLVCSR